MLDWYDTHQKEVVMVQVTRESCRVNYLLCGGSGTVLSVFRNIFF